MFGMEEQNKQHNLKQLSLKHLSSLFSLSRIILLLLQ